ncbi:MAG: site-specific integrase, partial [Clostridia bacterium]|nr:site-specific integrase [Clostridia bacterium]
GTIRKLTGRRQRPYAAYLPRSMGGKYVGSYKSKAEASDALALIVATRPTSKRAEWTVQDFYEAYIASPQSEKLSKSMKDNDRAAWKYCHPIANQKMRDTRTQEWQSCIDYAAEQGKSRSTCMKIRNLASKLCKEAMKDDVINKNYASLLTIGGENQKPKDIFTDKEIAFLKAHDVDIEAKFILILIYTGMRISELLELTNDNVHDTYIIGGKKTAAGKNRIIPILPEISPYINFFKRDEGLFIHNNGKPVGVKYARQRWFYDYLVQLNILCSEEIPPNGTPRLTPHCTRHTFATLARQAGIDKDVLIRVIGHSDYSVTDDVYVDMQSDFLREELLKMSSVPSSDTENV